MRFAFNNNDYELMEFTEPNRMETFDIIGIFRVEYCIWLTNDFVEVSKEIYDKATDKIEKYEFVDYYYGTDVDDEVLIEQAKEYIEGRNT